MSWLNSSKACFLSVLRSPPLRMLGAIAIWVCVFGAVAFITLLFVALLQGCL